MRRQALVATTAIAGCAVALTGCGSKSNSATHNSTAVRTSTAVSTHTSTATSTATSMSTDTSTSTTSGAPSASHRSSRESSRHASSTSSSTGAASGTCTGGKVSATINGKSKCLAAGQECSAKAVDQYQQYGFVCEQKDGKQYILRKANS